MPRTPMILPLRTAAFWQDPYPILDEARDQARTAVGESGEPVTLAIDDLEAVSGHPAMAPPGPDALAAPVGVGATLLCVSPGAL